MSVLRGLLQDLGAELQDEPTEIKSTPKVAPGKAAEVRMLFSPSGMTLPPAVCEAAIQRDVLLMICLSGRMSH